MLDSSSRVALNNFDLPILACHVHAGSNILPRF